MTAYSLDRTPVKRDAAITTCMPIVQKFAEMQLARLPMSVELDDLVSSGTLGLIDAVESFDPSKATSFVTYSSLRIRGAMLDEVRELDFVPRLTRTNARKREAAEMAILLAKGRTGTDAEIIKALGGESPSNLRVMGDSRPAGTVSLYHKYFETDSNKDFCEIDNLSDAKAINAGDALEARESFDRAKRGFSRSEKLIIDLHYCESMTMKEIGRTIGITESRVSQIHSSIIARLRARFEDAPMLAPGWFRNRQAASPAIKLSWPFGSPSLPSTSAPARKTEAA